MEMLNEKLLRINDVIALTGLSRGSIYGYMKLEKFPKNRKFGKSSFWSYNEVQQWIVEVLE